MARKQKQPQPWAFTRPDADGSFDEFIAHNCHVHAEMMDDKTLWIGITPHGPAAKGKSQWVMWISANGKLRVRAEED